MKPHIIVQLRQDLADQDFAHWESLIRDKSLARSRILPSIDKLLDQYRLPVWVAREYAPAGGSWSQDEIASGLNRVYRLILQENTSIPPELIRAINLIPDVEEARSGRIGYVNLPPSQPQALSIDTGRASRHAIGLDEAHRFTTGEPEITVAVLDTGIAVDHPELVHAMAPGYDFVDILDGASTFFGDYLGADADPDDEVGHGTHVAGIIGGKGAGMPAGVVPRCRILPVRVLAAMRQGDKSVGAGMIENINNGVVYAINQGASVINMSLGVRHSGGGLPHREVIDYARRKGVTVVAASGNDGRETLYYPGAFESVLAVGAVNRDGRVAHFSTYGRQVSFVAPGEEIYSAYLNDQYAFSSGTSHAAPFVTGAVAMLKSYARSKGMDLSDSQVKHVLKHTADKFSTRFKDPKGGFGMINLADALRLLDSKLAVGRSSMASAA